MSSEDADTYTPDSEYTNGGFLVGTFAATGMKGDKKAITLSKEEFLLYQAYGFYLRKIEDEDQKIKADIGLKKQGFGFVRDYRLKDGIGYAFAIPLPEGKYEFYNYDFDDGAKKWKARKDFSIVIEIKAGRALYIGETVAHKKYAESVSGTLVSAGGYFTSSDQLERDKVILARKFPVLANIKFDTAILAPGLDRYYKNANEVRPASRE